MRIVQLLTQARGGPADHAFDVARELARRGHDSHLVGPLDAVCDQLQDAGVQCHDVAMRRKDDVMGALQVARRIRALRPDVLHCQDRRASLIGRPLGRSVPRTALVYTIHGVADGLSDLVAGNLRAAPRRRRDRLYYITAEHLLNLASPARIVTPSRAIADYAITHLRLPESLVDVVPNGIDTARFALHTPTLRTPLAVWVGLMGPVKRLDVLVEAFSAVPCVDLRLVGDGPERASVERLVNAVGLTQRVNFTGTVNDSGQCFADADLFVLMSAAENCPLALLQAMACGLPVVATRVGGIPEIVRDGVDGLLVPPGDPNSFAHALRTLAADSDLRRRMGANGQERIATSFTLGGCVDGLLSSYRKALECTS